jgi:hypothetical protein
MWYSHLYSFPGSAILDAELNEDVTVEIEADVLAILRPVDPILGSPFSRSDSWA